MQIPCNTGYEDEILCHYMRFVTFNITSALEIVVTSVSGGVEFLNHKFGHGAQLEYLVKNSDESLQKVSRTLVVE